MEPPSGGLNRRKTTRGSSRYWLQVGPSWLVALTHRHGNDGVGQKVKQKNFIWQCINVHIGKSDQC